jgi:hypothetical protein
MARRLLEVVVPESGAPEVLALVGAHNVLGGTNGNACST